MSQSHVHGAGANDDDEQPLDGAPGASGRIQASISTSDDLLDEIDVLLESNAESFVKSFVQKGGQ